MGRTTKIIDLKPNEPIYEHDVVTFKKTDATRGSKKGEVGTVVDLFFSNKNQYEVLTQLGDVCTYKREEFRLATPEDIAKHKADMAAQETKKAATPKALDEISGRF
jgi:hypothetical protein